MSLSVSRQRKVKIVCTIGPSSSSEKVIGLLIRNGMNVARLNFSHGGLTITGKILNGCAAVIRSC
jgi:pyruvate kinase